MDSRGGRGRASVDHRDPGIAQRKARAEGARALAELLNEVGVQMRGDVIEIAADRFERRLAQEIAVLRAELGGLRADMGSEIGMLRSEMHSEIGKLRSELHSEIGKLRADMGAFEGRIMRWMFVFWIGQIGALLGILFAFFRP